MGIAKLISAANSETTTQSFLHSYANTQKQEVTIETVETSTNVQQKQSKSGFTSKTEVQSTSGFQTTNEIQSKTEFQSTTEFQIQSTTESHQETMERISTETVNSLLANSSGSFHAARAELTPALPSLPGSVNQLRQAVEKSANLSGSGAERKPTGGENSTDYQHEKKNLVNELKGSLVHELKGRTEQTPQPDIATLKQSLVNSRIRFLEGTKSSSDSTFDTFNSTATTATTAISATSSYRTTTATAAITATPASTATITATAATTATSENTTSISALSGDHQNNTKPSLIINGGNNPGVGGKPSIGAKPSLGLKSPINGGKFSFVGESQKNGDSNERDKSPPGSGVRNITDDAKNGAKAQNGGFVRSNSKHGESDSYAVKKPTENKAAPGAGNQIKPASTTPPNGSIQQNGGASMLKANMNGSNPAVRKMVYSQYR